MEMISPEHAVTYRDVLGRLRGVMNGMGNIYRIPLTHALKQQ
jgi:hypothetical protein